MCTRSRCPQRSRVKEGVTKELQRCSCRDPEKQRRQAGKSPVSILTVAQIGRFNGGGLGVGCAFRVQGSG